MWAVAQCRECTGRRLGFASARAAVTYSRAGRALLSAWKEHGLRRAASLAADLVAERVEPPAADVIAYIPPDSDRLLERGHHPAEALARGLGRRWELDVRDLLTRQGAPRGRQATLGRVARRANVRGAFRSAGSPPARVLLVDDVYTTGATASAAATALRAAGARRVDVVTFARTVLR